MMTFSVEPMLCLLGDTVGLGALSNVKQHSGLEDRELFLQITALAQVLKQLIFSSVP